MRALLKKLILWALQSDLAVSDPVSWDVIVAAKKTRQ